MRQFVLAAAPCSMLERLHCVVLPDDVTPVAHELSVSGSADNEAVLTTGQCCQRGAALAVRRTVHFARPARRATAAA